MEKKQDEYMKKAKQFANVESFRASLGIAVGIFFIVMMTNPLESYLMVTWDSYSTQHPGRNPECLVLYLLTLYFIADLTICRALMRTLKNPGVVTQYPVDLGIWVILQFLLLTFSTTVGGYLVWSGSDSEELMKRMSILLLILYSYKLYSFILAYSISGRDESKSTKTASNESNNKELQEVLQTKV